MITYRYAETVWRQINRTSDKTFVKVTRMFETGESGFEIYTAGNIGLNQTYRIYSHGLDGIQLDNNYLYPFFCLEVLKK